MQQAARQQALPKIIIRVIIFLAVAIPLDQFLSTIAA
jgi:hypothetical protein